MKKFILFISALFVCVGAVAHTVNWHVDGQIIHTTTCSSGDSITPPTAPTKYGYHLKAWGSKLCPNIFDGQWKTGIYAMADGIHGEAANRICNVNMMKIKPSTDYIVSFNDYIIGNNFRWVFYDVNGNFVSSQSGRTTTKTPATAEYLNIYIANNLTIDTAPDMQIEEGLTATPYCQYGSVKLD